MRTFLVRTKHGIHLLLIGKYRYQIKNIGYYNLEVLIYEINKIRVNLASIQIVIFLLLFIPTTEEWNPTRWIFALNRVIQLAP